MQVSLRVHDVTCEELLKGIEKTGCTVVKTDGNTILVEGDRAQCRSVARLTGLLHTSVVAESSSEPTHAETPPPADPPVDTSHDGDVKADSEGEDEPTDDELEGEDEEGKDGDGVC